MNPKILEGAGLTEGEAKVYLSLLKLGQTKTGPLAKEARVSSSKVYKILDRLEKKGLVGHVVKVKTKHYTAMNPKRVLDYLDEKEKQLQEKRELVRKIIPELELAKKLSSEKTEVTLFTGFKAITNVILGIVDELKRGETYYVISAVYGERAKSLRPFFYKHHKRRAAKGVRLKMLANHETKNNLEKTTYLKSQIRFLPHYFATNMPIFFYKNKTFIVIWTKEPHGILLEDKEAVNSFKAYFEILWKIAKK